MLVDIHSSGIHVFSSELLGNLIVILLICVFVKEETVTLSNQEYSVEFSSYFNVMWTEPRLHIPDR